MRGESASATESAAEDLGLVRKPAVARAAAVSQRTIDSWVREKRIPIIRLSPRCVRFSIPAVLRALNKFEIQEVSR
jgi:predicted DNA-binding transcriptional regulator AlpA